ncbi:mevalonate kinase/galactokinase [Holotrichia oblita]|uniref:Mevalonate kinase/galactokinase n=1 Tax=Holotrichia oblita TaxID=644536 RepID=A0ACB9TS52_HOLOL|nr:mevalonate kinase/galactokinase [Holotrichia oblita]
MPQIESGTCTISTFPLPANERTSNLLSLFTERFGHQPEFFVKVPGRVNLIGEHVDYCGYGVCPMALEQDMLLAVSSCENSTLLKIANLNAEVYCDYEGDLEKLEIKIEGAPKWYQYVLCGIKGILEILPSDITLRGLTILVHGTVPPNAGLSSSSALVSAAALATSHAHNQRISKEKLANLCAECERYIGTQGGGMDQAIAFLATEGQYNTFVL